MDSGQFAASTRMCCQRTPEPSRVVVRLHRTTDPPRAHLWATFLCEQKGGSLAGRREKRLANLATANIKSRRACRNKHVTRLASVIQSESDEVATT